MQTGKSIQEALVSCGIGDSDYKDVIQAMYLAAPKDPAAHAKNNYDQNGLHVPHTSIIRFFGKASIRIEDHGAVYAVWIMKTDDTGGTTQLVGYAQLNWGQRL